MMKKKIPKSPHVTRALYPSKTQSGRQMVMVADASISKLIIRLQKRRTVRYEQIQC